jgi:hypothetical protein
MPNAKGVLVVEVDKACRDLKMLLKTIRGAKFYRALLGGEGGQEDAAVMSSEEEDGEEQQRGSNHEASLQRYRQILNRLMREIVKMNQSAEAQSKAQEIYRVKLLSAELRDQIQKLKSQVNSQSVDNQCETILNFYQTNT